MKFGAVPVARGRGRRRGPLDPPGRLVLKKGTRDRQDRRSPRCRQPASPRSWWRGSSRATCRKMRRRPRSRPRSRARACASIAPSRAAPICSPRAPACWWSTRTPSIASTSVDEAITFATLAGLQAGGRRRDDRDGEDHSVRGRRARARRCARPRAAPRRWCGSRPIASARSASSRRCCRDSPTKVIEKTLRVTEERLAPAGATIVAERRVPHEQGALAKAIEEVLGEGAELVVVFGASAIADRRDVIPAAVDAIGGRIEHFGMPVDPGNLLLVADARGRPVLGAPGCARSPKENGFDWVLMRLLAGLAGRRARHHRHGRRRPADGNRHAAAAARRSRRRSRRGGVGRRRARGRPLDPHGRAEQAAGRDRRHGRWCASRSRRRWPRARGR